MITDREEVLVAGVEARLALRKKEARMRWIKGIVRAVFPPAFFGVLLFSLSQLFIPTDFQRIYTLVIVFAAFGWSCLSVIGCQRKRIDRLEERVRILEENSEPNKAADPTAINHPPSPTSPAPLADISLAKERLTL